MPAASSKVRVRFAPSPTGYLHIGGARTALFNWLYARHTGGDFVLRIEDTDSARNSQAAVDVILDGLRWLGLDWDEGPVSGDADQPGKGGCGPYFQSRRGDVYKKRAEELRQKGLAYEKDGALMFRMPTEPMTIPDLVVGDVVRELTDREQVEPEFVLVRSDGQPVFHFVNVVDDLEMGITHVIRGEDHLSNTAKHLALFKAFGVDAPKYAHIPLILNPNGSKMSKRDTGASLASYMEGGFLPEGVVNYLYLLGWSPKGNREILPLAEVVSMFDLPQILRHNARFDADKLAWVNGEHLKLLPKNRFADLARAALTKSGLDLAKWPEEYVRAAIATCEGKIKHFPDMAAYAGFYFRDDFSWVPEVVEKDFKGDPRSKLEALRDAFAAAPEWNAPALEAALKATAARLGIKAGPLVHPCRMAVTAASAGPSLYHLLEVLGRDRVMARIQGALAAGAV